MSKLSEKERLVYRMYKTPNQTNIYKRKVNGFHFSAANTFEHELKKFELGFELLKTGCKFLMEAERTKKDGNGKRRIVDLVQLCPHIEWEVETDWRRALRFKGDGLVRVVKVGWSESDLKKYLGKVKG